MISKRNLFYEIMQNSKIRFYFLIWLLNSKVNVFVETIISVHELCWFYVIFYLTLNHEVRFIVLNTSRKKNTSKKNLREEQRNKRTQVNVKNCVERLLCLLKNEQKRNDIIIIIIKQLHTLTSKLIVHNT